MIDTPQGKKQVLELTTEWWALYHRDMKAMKEEISVNRAVIGENKKLKNDEMPNDHDSEGSLGEAHFQGLTHAPSFRNDIIFGNQIFGSPHAPSRPKTTKMHSQPREMTFPLSIGILKRIILMRAANKEFINIKGIIDNYFYVCAHSPEVKKHPLRGVELGL